MVIHLRSNKFMGDIPPQICQLSYHRVLDLANNSLSRTIPKCLNNISNMTEGLIEDDFYVLEVDYYYYFFLIGKRKNILSQ